MLCLLGLNIYIQDAAKVIHQSHNRSDGLFDHIKGKHLIMDRYRNLLKKEKENKYEI